MKVVPSDDLRRWINENETEFQEQPLPPSDKFRLIWPTEPPKIVTQAYGINPQWYKPFGLKGHEGVDFRAANGSKIFAAAAGRVYRVEAADAGAYGIHVRIEHDHPDGPFKTVYAHFREAGVKVGDEVNAGQVIGLADNTGNSSGPHLHLTLKKVGDGSPWLNFSDIVNPTLYMPDLFPGDGWRIDVGGNFRTQPFVANNVIRYIPSGPIVRATGEWDQDWWEIVFEGVKGWFWNPSYKMRAI